MQKRKIFENSVGSEKKLKLLKGHLTKATKN